MITKTLHTSQEKWKLVYPDQCYQQKSIRGSRRQRYTYSTRWMENNLAVLHIYGARAIFNYFVITKTINLSHEKCKKSVAGKISNQKNNSKCSMGQRYPDNTVWEKNIVAILRIYGDRAIVLLFNDDQGTGYQ